TIRLAMVTSEAAKAYRASIDWSALSPLGDLISISTSSDVKSLMLLTLILALREASSMEPIKESVVVVGGISLMTTVESSLALILARTLIWPAPSRYSRAFMRPPV